MAPSRRNRNEQAARIPRISRIPRIPNPCHTWISIPISKCFFYKKWLAISLNTRRRTGSTGSHQPPLGHWATGMNSQMRIILIDLVDHMMNHMISYAICNIFLRTVTRPFWSRFFLIFVSMMSQWVFKRIFSYHFMYINAFKYLFLLSLLALFLQRLFCWRISFQFSHQELSHPDVFAICNPSDPFLWRFLTFIL